MPHTVILGAGVIGVCTAYFLSHDPFRNEDHTITILDPSPPASGASGKAGGFIARNWVSTATTSLEDLSFRLHEQLAQEYGGNEKWGYRSCRTLHVIAGNGSEPGDSVWDERHKNVKKTPYSGDVAWIKPGMIKKMELLGDPGSFAQCDPYLFTVFLLEKAKSKGVKFLRGSASSLSIESNRVTQVHMICTDGTNLSLPCDNVVIAAGPWTGPLSKSLLPTPIPITPYAGHSIVLRPSAKVTEDVLFMTLNTQHSSYPEIFPRPGGEIYIGGVNDNLALPPTPEDVVLQERDLKKLRDIANEIFTDYTIEKEQLCFRPMTESATPFISPVPEVSGAYVGAGHSYSGIMLGPGTGKVLSEMVLGKELSADVSQLKLK